MLEESDVTRRALLGAEFTEIKIRFVQQLPDSSRRDAINASYRLILVLGRLPLIRMLKIKFRRGNLS